MNEYHGLDEENHYRNMTTRGKKKIKGF